MSAKKNCSRCEGTGIEETGNNDITCRCIKGQAFDALHMVYHERDFRVRVNDPTISFVKRILSQEVGLAEASPSQLVKLAAGDCPACLAGYDFFDLQPNDQDRRR